MSSSVPLKWSAQRWAAVVASSNCAAMRTRFPALRTEPSSTYKTPSSRPTCLMSLSDLILSPTRTEAPWESNDRYFSLVLRLSEHRARHQRAFENVEELLPPHLIPRCRGEAASLTAHCGHRIG